MIAQMFRVPGPGDEPSPALVEYLADSPPFEWDGDDEGLNLWLNNRLHVPLEPGDVFSVTEVVAGRIFLLSWDGLLIKFDNSSE